jgi:zf-MYND-like zinc finger, mRNA-binding
MSTHSCQGCGKLTESTLCCPKCAEYKRETFFCSQSCFASNWANHTPLHSILQKNHQMSLQEQISRKANITSSAIQSLKHLITQKTTKKIKTDDDPEAMVLQESSSNEPLLKNHKMIFIILFILLGFLFLLKITSRSSVQEISDVPGGAMSDEMYRQLKEELDLMKVRMDSQEDKLRLLARDLKSGLREVTGKEN